MKLPHGSFGWIDLMTTDVPAAKAFYGELFGWTSVDMPMGPDYAYTQFRKDGRLVAGLGPMPPGGPEMPVAWSSYVMVGDADAVLAAVPGAGGQVIAPAMDIMSQGRMAMIADPSGAVVGLWQPMDHQGAELFNAPGSLTWNELQTRDLEPAMAFYASVLGWTWAEGPGNTGYQMGSVPLPDAEPRMNCGAMSMPPGVPDEVPSFWAVYFAVEDCDASLAFAEALGGSVFMPAMDMGPGRFGGVIDPTGGMFFLGYFPQSQG